MIKKEEIIRFFQRVMRWLRYWLWKNPISKPEPLKATEVVENWTVIMYNGQKINLHLHEVPLFHGLSRSDKRAMALRFEVMEKKGQIKFMEINGQMTCVRNLNYTRRAEKKKAEQNGN